MALFVDASVFCAYANKDDVHHAKAKAVLLAVAHGDHGKAITTDYVFDESVTVALRKASKAVALELGSAILDGEVLLVKVGTIAFSRAWELFKKTHGLSFTDCTNLTCMELFGITTIATFDKGFTGIPGITVIG